MLKLDFKKTLFIKSAAYFSQCVSDQGKEIAFVGRSNVGKSSALNVLVGHKLARTSKSPGRTQLINFFEIKKNHRLVDLPGYGYAKVPEEVKKRWEENLTCYFQERKSLIGIVLLCDLRHLLKENDFNFINFILNLQLPLHLVLTKSDKLSKHEGLEKLKKLVREFKDIELMSFQLFSAHTKEGLDILELQLQKWFNS